MADQTWPFGKQQTAGDAWSWTIDLTPNYAAGAYTLKIFLRAVNAVSGTVKLDLPATAQGSLFAIAAAGSDTSPLAPGDWSWQVCVYDANNNRTELDRGTLAILGDISAAAGVFDGRTFAKQMLDGIRANLKGIAGRVEQEYQIGGRHLKLMTRTELLKFEGEFAARVRREAIENGELGPQTNNVHFRFGPTSGSVR